MNFKNGLLSGLIFLTTMPLWAGVSASRNSHESFEVARSRHVQSQVMDMHIQGESAWSVADTFEKMDFSAVADVGSMEKLNEIFHFIRDTKFIGNQPAPLSERRLSWLYPDDGCYVRAELASYFTNEKKMPETYKFFSFGDLAVKSSNHPDGVVRWWYHVVPIYRVGSQAYVIDPSIDARGPMTIEEWKKSQETEVSIEKFAVCKPRTVGPEDSCATPRGQGFDSLLRAQKEFLHQEWFRVKNLGRSPEAELGNTPPW